MSDLNKPIVAKTQKILQDLGYEVKTSHVYELLSRMAGEKNWHIAKPRNIQFSKIISQLKDVFEPASVFKPFSFNDFKNSIKREDFRDKFFLGYHPKGLMNLKDYFIEPNSLFVGSMGTGKSLSLHLSLLTWLLTNGDQTLVFIVDPHQGAIDYRNLIQFPQVIQSLSSSGLHEIIDILYKEAIARKDELNRVKASNIKDYERSSHNKLTRIVLVLEEFQNQCESMMNFNEQVGIEGTTAQKFHTLMRIGRSLGIWVTAVSQKGTSSDIPSKIVPNFTQKHVFRATRAEGAYILGNTKSADIKPDQKGRCETDEGAIQFPLLTTAQQEDLIQEFKTDSQSTCLTLSSEDIKKLKHSLYRF
jgi:hypothetical protein